MLHAPAVCYYILTFCMKWNNIDSIFACGTFQIEMSSITTGQYSVSNFKADKQKQPTEAAISACEKSACWESALQLLQMVPPPRSS